MQNLGMTAAILLVILVTPTGNGAHACYLEAEIEASKTAETIVADLADNEQRFERLCLGGEAFLHLGKLGQSAATFAKAASVSIDDIQLSDAKRRQGYANLYAGNMLTARRNFQASVTAAKRSGDKQDLFQALNGFAGVSMGLSDPEGAADALDAAINAAVEVYETTSDDNLRNAIARMHYNSSQTLVELGRIPEARTRLLSVDRFLRDTDPPFFLLARTLYEGEIARYEGDLEGSKQILESVLENIDLAPVGARRMSVYMTLVDTYEALGDINGMKRMSAAIFENLAQVQPPSQRLERLAYEVKGRVLKKAGDFEGAAVALKKAYDAAERFYEGKKAQEMARLEAEFAKGEREAEIAKLQAENDLRNAKLNRQRIIIGLALLIVAITFLASYLLWRQQKAKNLLAREYAVTEERFRIAREIHDTLLQSVTAMGIKIQMAKNNVRKDPAKSEQLMQETLQGTDYAVAEARSAIESAREPVPFDLLSGLRRLLRQEAEHSEIKTQLNVDGNFEDLNIAIKTDLQKIAGEAVKNAAKHAEPSTISISVARSSSGIEMCIEDDGCGFEAKALHPGHFGLLGMRERVERRNGSFVIDSSKGLGTKIRISLPCTTHAVSPVKPVMAPAE